MSLFRDVIRSIHGFLSDSESEEKPKAKPRIQELATQRVQALQGRWEVVEAQVKLAAQTRQELKKLVAEAKAVETIGIRAMAANNNKKAEAAQARYVILQETIQQMTTQAQTADQEAQEALVSFKTEANAARRSVSEAKALAQLEHVLELQKKHRALEITQSTAADEFEEAKDQLLLETSVQAATQNIQKGEDELAGEIAAELQDFKAQQIGEEWRKRLAEANGKVDAEFEIISSDASEEAIQFLDRPVLGGLLGHQATTPEDEDSEGSNE